MTLVPAMVALPLHVLYGSNVQNVWMQTVGYSVNAVLFAALIGWLLDGPRLARALEWGPLRHAGRASYGAYLYHLPLIGLFSPLRDRLQRYGTGSPSRDAAAHLLWACTIAALTFLVATISFRWVEQPLLAVRATPRDLVHRGLAQRAASRFSRRAV